MANLKMRFKLNGLEFELEGEEIIVKEEFGNFKSFITQDLLSRVDISSPVLSGGNVIEVSPELSTNTTTKQPSITEVEYPVMKEIVKRDLPKTESDWILIYGFYASKFGEDFFSEKDIREGYIDSGRMNESRGKNISNNITTLLNKGFIKIHNDTQYIIKEGGIDYIHSILEGTGGKAKKNHGSDSGKKTGDKKKLKSSQQPKVLSDLNLMPKGEQSLRDFFSSFKVSSNFERNLIFAYYLNRILKIEGINMDHIYTCYKDTSQKVPENLYQSLADTKKHKSWINTTDMNSITITITGENYMEHDISKQ